jgi:hypothetical protein
MQESHVSQSFPQAEERAYFFITLWLLYNAIANSKKSSDGPLCVVLVPYKALILNHRGFKAVVSRTGDTEAIVSQNIDRALIKYTIPYMLEVLHSNN